MTVDAALVARMLRLRADDLEVDMDLATAEKLRARADQIDAQKVRR